MLSLNRLPSSEQTGDIYLQYVQIIIMSCGHRSKIGLEISEDLENDPIIFLAFDFSSLLDSVLSHFKEAGGGSRCPCVESESSR